MLTLPNKLKYAAFFALSFAVLAGMAFLAGLSLNIQFAPPPVAQALTDLFAFAPIITIAALVLSFIQAFLALWLATHHKKWFWPTAIVLAIIFGGLASFFSLFGVWVIVTIINIALNLVMIRFLELRQFKVKENGAL